MSGKNGVGDYENPHLQGTVKGIMQIKHGWKWTSGIYRETDSVGNTYDPLNSGTYLSPCLFATKEKISGPDSNFLFVILKNDKAF